MTGREALEDMMIEFDEYGYEPTVTCDVRKEIENYKSHYSIIKQDLDRLENFEQESKESLKISTLLKNKVGYIKSQKGRFMTLKISHITHNGYEFIVNGWCIDNDKSRTIPLRKVYIDWSIENE